MFIHWLLHKPILLVVACLLGVALVIVLADVLQYFGYYFHNQWTEATWIDDVTSSRQQDELLDEEQRDIPTKPLKK